MFLAVSVALILTASAAQITQTLIDKLLGFSVKEIITGPVFESVWKSSKTYGGMSPSGYQAYHNARSSTYDNLGLKWTDWESYIQGRTIIVARIKSYFFDGENLKDTYLAIQPRFKTEFSKLSDKEKKGLRQTLSEAKTCFEMMLQLEQQKKYDIWLNEDSLGNSRVDNLKLAENWLVNNLSAEDIAKRIKEGELTEPAEKFDIEEEAFKAYPDKTIAKFSGRRFKEGGEELLRKYIEVIDLAIADVK